MLYSYPLNELISNLMPATGLKKSSLHILEGTMNAERYIKVLEQHMLPSRRRVFQQDNAKPYTAAITTAWLQSRRVRVLNWPACSPDLSPIENIWRRPRTLQQLETNIRQEWEQIPNQNSRNSYPRCSDVFKLFENKKRYYTIVNMPRSNYFETCSRHQIWN